MIDYSSLQSQLEVNSFNFNLPTTIKTVKRKEDKGDYALKKVKMLNLSEKEKENALNEVRILASLTHTNVVSYKEAFIDETSSSLW